MINFQHGKKYILPFTFHTPLVTVPATQTDIFKPNQDYFFSLEVKGFRHNNFEMHFDCVLQLVFSEVKNILLDK